jgi:hypothetical protein
MIAERLRLMFAEDRRPLLARHSVFGLALVPVPLIRTGFSEFILVGLIFPSPDGAIFALGLLILFLLVSLPLAPIFIAWSLPGTGRPGLPQRSLGLLAFLIAYYPLRLYLNNIVANAETRAEIANMHAEFPIVLLLKHLDAPFLLGLLVWAIRRWDVAQAKEKIWFHWLLFVCALWAACALFDSSFGLFVTRLY